MKHFGKIGLKPTKTDSVFQYLTLFRSHGKRFPVTATERKEPLSYGRRKWLLRLWWVYVWPVRTQSK